MQNPNFLILDEPTNDLDIATLEVLEDYLHGFSGCVLVVSHDRYFLDEVVDHVFVFEGLGKIKDFPGNYTQYYQWKQQTEKEILQKKQPEKKEKPKNAPTQKKISFNEKLEFEKLEKEIGQLEAEKKEIETFMSSGNLSSDDLHKKSERIGEILKLLSIKSDRWFELAEKAG
jgi:ATP-binding cassette subfamily F protein uup